MTNYQFVSEPFQSVVYGIKTAYIFIRHPIFPGYIRVFLHRSWSDTCGVRGISPRTRLQSLLPLQVRRSARLEFEFLRQSFHAVQILRFSFGALVCAQLSKLHHWSFAFILTGRDWSCSDTSAVSDHVHEWFISRGELNVYMLWREKWPPMFWRLIADYQFCCGDLWTRMFRLDATFRGQVELFQCQRVTDTLNLLYNKLLPRHCSEK